MPSCTTVAWLLWGANQFLTRFETLSTWGNWHYKGSQKYMTGESIGPIVEPIFLFWQMAMLSSCILYSWQSLIWVALDLVQKIFFQWVAVNSKTHNCTNFWHRLILSAQTKIGHLYQYPTPSQDSKNMVEEKLEKKM